MKPLLRRFFVLILAACLFPIKSHAVPLAPEQIPDTLRAWVDWALYGHEEERCPYLNGQGDDRICGWASRLDLNIEEKQGTFSQQWVLYRDDWVSLPGDDKRWPLGVKADGQGAAVVLHDATPSVFLKKGTHLITGSYAWDHTPENFRIPRETGLLHLSLKGQGVDFPQLDENGLLWLEKESGAKVGEERLDVRVNRRIEDGIPLTLTTEISLDAAGKAREVVLGKVMLEDFTLMSIDSPIPARIEDDGRLKIQVRAGTWKITLKARHRGPVQSLTLPKEDPPLTAEEVWVFDARNNLRLVSVEGVLSVDPQQTTLPDDWKRFPAFRMRPGETMQLVERRRGDADPPPDQLTLFRRLWLDFDGGGYTIQDTLSGTLNRSFRLEMNAPVQLGRVAIGGQDQFITQLDGEKRAGIEIRQGQLQVNADSRLGLASRAIPAVGWNHDFQRVNGELSLPPGWGLFAVTGADEVPGTWIGRWDLLSIFMVMIIFLVFAKLWGKWWGLLALLGLALTCTEPDAPRWIWLALLAGAALLRLLKDGKLRTLLRIYVGITAVILIVICVPFMIRQMRQGMYPALEHSYQSLEATGASAPVGVANGNEGFFGGKQRPIAGEMAQAQTEAAPPAEAPVMRDAEVNAPAPAKPMMAKLREAKKEKTLNENDEHIGQEEQEKAEDKFDGSGLSTGKSRGLKPNYDRKALDNLMLQRPGTKVQTGPGLPHWDWNRFSLQWNGPVEKTQTLHLFLISPAANLFLAVLRVLLLALLVLCVLGLPGDFWPRVLKPRPAVLGALLLVFFLGWGAKPAHADYPSNDLLNALKERVLQNPECFPNCATISRMQLNVGGKQLRAVLEIGAEGTTAVPLPGNFKEWFPQQVTVDGQPFAGLHRAEDGQLWIQLAPGLHQVVLEGPLPDRSSVQIALPLKPHRLEAQVADWALDGLQENGLSADNLQLTRLQALGPDAQAPKQTSLPPFVSVERHLMLGLNWELQTRVVRLTPPGTAFVAEVPLLPGESVTDAEVQVKDNKVSVSMAPNATEFEWHSVLAESDKLALQAMDSYSMTEVWQLDLNPVWHVEIAGIPPVHPANGSGRWPMEWRPWPGERVTLSISRPAGIVGQTLTIDQSLLSITPGLRFTESNLSLMLRSSLGGQHVLTMPEGSVLQSVSINGTAQPIRQEGLKVTLPLIPGAQRVELVWQQPLALKSFFRSPQVSLGAPSVNAETQVHLPENRWVLFAGGLEVGPAVLFWSLLAILLLASAVLGRIGLTPLKTHHWLLLGLGLTQVPIWASVIVTAWLLALGWRERRPFENKWKFDLFQVFLVIGTLAALAVVFVSIEQGLLGMPDMQIAGNGSSNTLLRWFQDRSGETLPRVWAISVPLFCYRLAMLAWALWLALALLRWLRWAWASFTSGGGWRALGMSRVKHPTNLQ